MPGCLKTICFLQCENEMYGPSEETSCKEKQFVTDLKLKAQTWSQGTCVRA